MSRRPYFQHFEGVACLDKSVSGIPNAIRLSSPQAGWRAEGAGRGRAGGPLLARCPAAGELKNDFKEETNVEFQRCGPQDS
jgi:hypothetical protein